MVRSIASFSFIILAVLALAGCRNSLSDERANAVLKDLARELTQMESPSVEQRMERVKAVCDKQGVDQDSFARYLKDHPGSEKVLAGYMTEILQQQLGERKLAFEKKLEDLRKEHQTAVDGIKADTAKRITQTEGAAKVEIEQLKADFEKKREATLKAISELRLQ